MVDVTVDAKPMAKLPYDPDVIPEAVKKRAAAVNALYAQNGQSNGSDGSTPQQLSEVQEPPTVPPVEAPPAPQTPEPVVSSPTETQPTSAEPPPSPDDWHHRYLAMQGRYNASQKAIGEMQEQMAQLGNELLHATQRASQPQRTYPKQETLPSYITEQDVQNYGTELIDVTQRAALHAVAPKFQEIERQNENLREQLAKEQRRALDQAVELAVPNYREIDRDPRWHRWLLGIDVLSGCVRQQLLNEAISAAAAPRVISFFRGFLNEEAATGHLEPAPYSQQAAPPREAAINLASLAAPGRARPATGGDAGLPLDKPTYTRAQIAQLYSQHRRGAYVGREAEWARQDADIIAAGREGRIRS